MSTLSTHSGTQHGCEPIKDQFYRIKLCPFYFNGRCLKGRNCTYAHSQEELRTGVSLYRTRICALWKQGRCDDEECKFAHGIDQLRSTDGYWKTRLCHFWTKGVTCPAGEKCRHAHGVSELRKRNYRLSNRERRSKHSNPAPLQPVTSDARPQSARLTRSALQAYNLLKQTTDDDEFTPSTDLDSNWLWNPRSDFSSLFASAFVSESAGPDSVESHSPSTATAASAGKASLEEVKLMNQVNDAIANEATSDTTRESDICGDEERSKTHGPMSSRKNLLSIEDCNAGNLGESFVENLLRDLSLFEDSDA